MCISAALAFVINQTKTQNHFHLPSPCEQLYLESFSDNQHVKGEPDPHVLSKKIGALITDISDSNLSRKKKDELVGAIGKCDRREPDDPKYGVCRVDVVCKFLSELRNVDDSQPVSPQTFRKYV